MLRISSCIALPVGAVAEGNGRSTGPYGTEYREVLPTILSELLSAEELAIPAYGQYGMRVSSYKYLYQASSAPHRTPAAAVHCRGRRGDEAIAWHWPGVLVLARAEIRAKFPECVHLISVRRLERSSSSGSSPGRSPRRPRALTRSPSPSIHAPIFSGQSG